MADEFPQSTVYYFKFMEENWQEVARNQPWQSPQQIQSQLWLRWTRGSAGFQHGEERRRSSNNNLVMPTNNSETSIIARSASVAKMASTTDTISRAIQPTISTDTHGIRTQPGNTTSQATDPGLEQLLLLLPPQLEAGGVSPAQAVVMAMEKWAAMVEEERQVFRQAARDENPGIKQAKENGSNSSANSGPWQSFSTSPTSSTPETLTKPSSTRNTLDAFESNNSVSSPPTTADPVSSTSKELKVTIANNCNIQNMTAAPPTAVFSPLDPGLEQLLLLLPPQLEAGGVTPAQAVTMTREKWTAMEEEEKQVYRQAAWDGEENSAKKMKPNEENSLNLSADSEDSRSHLVGPTSPTPGATSTTNTTKNILEESNNSVSTPPTLDPVNSTSKKLEATIEAKFPIKNPTATLACFTFSKVPQT